jgi:predicted nucleotidyltransferase
MTDREITGLGIDDLIGDKREAILHLAEKRGAHNIRIFGSVARSAATPESDIDFLVDFEPNYRLLDQIGLMVDLSELLGRKVDVAVASNLRDELRADILEDATPL